MTVVPSNDLFFCKKSTHLINNPNFTKMNRFSTPCSNKPMNFLTVERDPNKRRVKPVEQACVLDFDEESSDDSDFRIEDHPEVSDDDDEDDSMDSKGEENGK